MFQKVHVILSVFKVQTKVKRSARKRLPFAVVVPTVIRVTWSLGSLLDPPSQLVGPDQWCILIAGHVACAGHWASTPHLLGKRTSELRAYSGHHHPPQSVGASDHHGHPPTGSDLGSKWAGHSFWALWSLWLMPVSAQT